MTLILNMSDPLLLAGEASLLVTLILSMSDPLLLCMFVAGPLPGPVQGAKEPRHGRQ